MITVRAPSGDKAVAAITVRTPSGDKAVSRMILRTPTGDKEIYSAGGLTLTVSASPASAVGSTASSSTATVTSNSVIAAATGGTPPYTYAWAYTSGSTDIDALSPSAGTTTFRADVGANSVLDANFTCTATDLRGRTGTVVVPVTLYNFGSGGI